MDLKSIYHKYKRKKNLKQILPYVKLSNESIYGDWFQVEIRQPRRDHVFLQTGEHSVIDGNFVFEKNSGKVTIGDRTHIGNSTFISINNIEIGNDVLIAWNCFFYDHNSHSVDWSERSNDVRMEYENLTSGKPILLNKNWDVVKSAPIKICDKAWIGYGAVILKGVTIGEGAVVAACSVVTKDVDPWTVVAGNPAVKIRKLSNIENCI